MPKISAKGKRMPQSPIRKLAPYADSAKNLGKKVYHLNIGQPDIHTPVNAINAIKNLNMKVLAYSKSEGETELRLKIAEYYRKLGIGIFETEIIVTNGASEALFFSLGSVMDPDDEIIIPEPFYANYNGFSAANGIKIVPILSSIDENFALPNISEFEKLITAKTRGIMICNPNNPTGYVYSRDEIISLVKHLWNVPV